MSTNSHHRASGSWAECWRWHWCQAVLARQCLQEEPPRRMCSEAQPCRELARRRWLVPKAHIAPANRKRGTCAGVDLSPPCVRPSVKSMMRCSSECSGTALVPCISLAVVIRAGWLTGASEWFRKLQFTRCCARPPAVADALCQGSCGPCSSRLSRITYTKRQCLGPPVQTHRHLRSLGVYISLIQPWWAAVGVTRPHHSLRHSWEATQSRLGDPVPNQRF